MNILGVDFEGRNWITLVRLARLGYKPKEAKQIMRDIEAGKLILKDVKKKWSSG